jgi:hypothetical protein
MADCFKADSIHPRKEDCIFTGENTHGGEYGEAYHLSEQLTTIILDTSRSM